MSTDATAVLEPNRPNPVLPVAAGAPLRTVFDVRLGPTKGSTAIARRLVQVGLARLRPGGDACGHRNTVAVPPIEKIALIAGALVGVSRRQTKSPFTLRLLVGGGVSMLELEDTCTDFPPLGSHRDTAAAELVEHVGRAAAAWGFRRLPHGRQLWARVDDGV